ncbi:MAG: class I SAM-dependent DNA methyltransferase [Alphaproteobacteria bacterium]|nr:class I SAM-dependent DNA methyltransferase [Alphaproteobacteria bacterium]
MALDLTGIDNRGEFYSHHYLDALLEGDLKPLLQAWSEAEQASPPRRSPWKALNGLAARYFSARAEAAELGPQAQDEAWALARGFHAHLLEALGHIRAPLAVPLEDGSLLPLAAELRRGGQPSLWILEAPFPAQEDDDPLAALPLRAQLPKGHREDSLPERSWRELLDTEIFRLDDAPTWVMLLSGREVLLTHRHKWGRGKALAFDLDALFARRQPRAFRAMAALLHQEALCPAEGVSLHEGLDESSHKHAFAVSTDLREGAERAIELLGNEAVWYLQNVRREGVLGRGASEALDAAQLTRDCLVWLYRLIFLFYVESRSEDLGVAPMKSEAYRRGYSLESLRDLEQVPLTSPEAQNGYFLYHSLQQLFRLVNEGHPQGEQLGLDAAGLDAAGFRIRGLRSRLFDDAQLSVLRRVKLRNHVLQEVVRLLSLSQEGKHKERGRISYASLGINQLGAVYEGLLSYTGFFATEDLIEVANAKENGKPDARSYFVPARLRERYTDEELVRDASGARVTHPRGTYLYRLAGRDREKSASYYTPEVLTRCLVKYTLRERIGVKPEDDSWVGADALLDLNVCEPAMGSGAFLNEVVNQLAEAYLTRKQAELDRVIPAERYPRELQRVKAHFAATRCYGVDLNPLAAELGKVSLWLNVLRPGAPAPFFDARIGTGNSLVGARLATYGPEDLHKASKGKEPNWLERAPEPLEGPRARDRYYHFLLPAQGMAAFDGDKVVKGLVPEAVEAVKTWRKGLKAGWTPAERLRLRQLSELVDGLYRAHAASRRAALAACCPPVPVWPEPDLVRVTEEATLATRWADAQTQDTEGRRLKAAMDYWCALWFWPLAEADKLPKRVEWLGDLEWLLGERGELNDARRARLAVAEAVAARHRFVHWEWLFPEVFEAGGFDVVVGNPPWVKLQWNEGGILSDLDPRLVIRRMSAKQMADARTDTLAVEGARAAYLGEFEELEGQKAFLNDVQNYPLLQGVQTNLYKAFVCAIWGISSPLGVSGVLHPEGPYDDPKGGQLRARAFSRLAYHLQFLNYLRLFETVLHKLSFSINIYGSVGVRRFKHMSNLFHPRTLDESLEHDGLGEVPAIKTPEGDWDLRGHASRVVEVDEAALALFAKLYDPPGTPSQEARLPVVHSTEVLNTLRRFGKHVSTESPRRKGKAGVHETDAMKQGLLERRTMQPDTLSELFIMGPHFFVGDPLRKTPNEECRHNQDYSTIELSRISEDYIPRTNYIPSLVSIASSSSNSADILPEPTGTYRHVHRRMAPPTGERTLAVAIVPPKTRHVNTVIAFAYDSSHELVRCSGLYSSLVYDFFVKSSGRSDIYEADLERLPLPATTSDHVLQRTLLLNCLTNHYADLWSELYTPEFNTDRFTKPDPRLPPWTHLGPDWTWETPLRTPYARRQALVELDALAALALGLTADELCLIYRVQFPVLQQYEADTWYDRRGRIVFTNNRGLNGVGLARKEWEQLREAKEGEALPEWAVDGLGAFVPPFDRCDREEDMRLAYEVFLERGVGPDEPQRSASGTSGGDQ